MAPALDPTHQIPSELWYEDIAPAYPVIRIKNAFASASIALHGAHLFDYTPHDQQPVIFTSEQAIFREGKAIRGGIPVCWPWFNAHPSDPSMPSHGFARDRFWQLSSSASTPDGTIVTLELDTSELDIWPHTTRLTLTILVGAKLELKLTTHNLGKEPVTIGGALHTYFCVGDIEQISLTGLENTRYLNTVDHTEHQQSGPIQFLAETDNVYKETRAEVVIHDPVLQREISVAKSGSTSTVVWNPWIEKSASMADLPNDAYKSFVCIEAANAHEDIYEVGPNESHTLETTISSRPIQ